MTRADRVRAVLAAVEAVAPAHLEWATDAILTKRERAARRLDPRDEAVRACFTELRGMDVTPAARRIETDLGRFLAAGWLLERQGARRPDPPGLEGAVRRLARANGGKALGARQLLNIAGGARRS